MNSRSSCAVIMMRIPLVQLITSEVASRRLFLNASLVLVFWRLQVERFACLYTSFVTNLCYYSPNKSYRTTEDFMPHELQGDWR